MLLLGLLAACTPGTYDGVGLGEPVRIREGVFHTGELPVDPDATAPLITNAGGVGSVVTEGQSSISYAGLASPDAYSVAIAFPDLGTGYWVLPVDGPDVTQNNELIFAATADFGVGDIPYGLQTLSFVAIDGDGKAGPRYDVTVCILPEAANNNLAACSPDAEPQSAVISLSWDTEVDLDLIVVAPNGKIVSGKQPTTALVDGPSVPNADVSDPSTGALSRDSNANCVIDGIHRESLVFPGEPPAGDYAVYASLHAPCHQDYVIWRAELYRRVADEGQEGWPVEVLDLGHGELLGMQASNGKTLGTYVTTVTLP